MKIITVLNQKGGVGKTTTAYNLGAGLAVKGKRVLLIDADAQCNLTYYARANADNDRNTMKILQKKAKIDESIQHAEGGDIVPGTPDLMNADIDIKAIGKESRLKEALAAMKTVYDFVIIDTPPRVDVATLNALTASHTCIIPAQADIFSLQGIEQLDDTIHDIRKFCGNPRLDVMGILLTRYKGRTLMARDIAEVVEKTAAKFKTRLFPTRIRECNAINEQQSAKTSIYDYAPRSLAAQDYASFVDDVLKLSNNRQKGGKRG